MPSAEQIDLNKKLRLERELFTELQGFNKRLVRQTVKGMSRGEGMFGAIETQPELSRMFQDHYDAVAPVFDHEISDELPEDIEETVSERALIAGALATFFALRAPKQSALVTKTNIKDIAESFDQATILAQELAATTGVVPDRINVAVDSGAILSRKLNGRARTIAQTETQFAAEAAKLTEAEVLTGQQPSLTAGSTPAFNPVNSIWRTRGDERVRIVPFNHVAADGQVQPVGGVFSVSGESLRFPGDESLGASLGNVINCRCRLEYPIDEIEDVRHERAAFTVTVERGE